MILASCTEIGEHTPHRCIPCKKETSYGPTRNHSFKGPSIWMLEKIDFGEYIFLSNGIFFFTFLIAVLGSREARMFGLEAEGAENFQSHCTENVGYLSIKPSLL